LANINYDRNTGKGKASFLDLTALLFILLILGLAGAAIFEVANPAAEAYLSSLLIEETLLPRSFTLEWLFAVPGFMIKFMLFPLTACLALLLMLIKPAGLLRSYKLEELSGREPELAQRFKALLGEMGIGVAPLFYWSPKDTQEAFVFKGFGPYRICFTRGLMECFKGRTKQLEAIAAHELAHIANKDVTRTEIAESLVKAYFSLWVLIAFFQVLGSLGLFIFFQQRSVALDISFAVSLVSLGVIYVIMNILSRFRQKYADARVVKLGRQEDLKGALSWLAAFQAAGGAANLRGARRLAFGSIARAVSRELPGSATIKQWLFAPDPTIWERLEAVINPAALYRPVWSLSLAAGFIVFGLTGTLPLSPLAGSILPWSLASILVGAGLAPAIRQKGAWRRAYLLVSHLVLCSGGFFVAHFLSSLTKNLAYSMPVPTEIAENVLRIEGLASPSPASFSAAAVEAWQNAIHFLPGLLAGLLIVLAAWGAVSRLAGKLRLKLFFSRPFPGRGLYSLGGLLLAGVFVFSSSSTFLGAYYFAEGYRTQVLGLTPAQVSPGGHSPNYIPQERVDSTLEYATRLYEQSIDANPEFMWPYIQLAQIYLLKGAYYEAVDLLSREPLLDRQSSVAYTLRGIAHNAAGRPEEAIGDYTEAISFDPDNLAAYTKRADLYFKRGDFELAAADLTRAIEINPGDQSAYVMRATSYANQGRYEAALEDYGKAAGLLDDGVLPLPDPDMDFNYRINLHLFAVAQAASYEMELAWYSLAVSVLQMDIFSQLISGERPQKTIETWFPLQFLYLKIGLCHSDLGRHDLAAEYYRKATVPPDRYPIGHDLSAGRAFLLLGKYDQAIEMLDRSINFSPEVKELYYYRGLALTYSGNIKAAFADFATFLGLAPGSPERYILARIKPHLPQEAVLLLEGRNNIF